MLLSASTLAIPLLLPKSSTSAPTALETRAAVRAAAERRVPTDRASRAAVAPRLAAVTETTVVATTLPPVLTTTTHHHHHPPATVKRATATTAKPRATTTTAKPRPKTTTTTAAPGPPPTAGTSTGNSQSGRASWYDAPAGTCAHRTLPKGLVLTVTNVGNGKQTTCRIADRGPYIDGRIVDLSRSGFEALAPISAGVISVRIDW